MEVELYLPIHLIINISITKGFVENNLFNRNNYTSTPPITVTFSIYLYYEKNSSVRMNYNILPAFLTKTTIIHISNAVIDLNYKLRKKQFQLILDSNYIWT